MTEASGRGHMYAVGRPYIPGRRVWPEVADYNYRAGGHELRLFMSRASGREVDAARTGRVDFGLLVELPEILVVSRFHAPDGKVVMSFDCSYQWHRVSPEERTEPPAWEEVNPTSRSLVTVILVEATTGIVLALRAMTYSPEFSRAFARAIAGQAAMPYDRAEHERTIAAIQRRFNTDQLWTRCQFHCTGGD